MAKRCTANSLDTPACHLAAASPIALTTPRRSQRETAVSDDNVESYQLPSHQLELPVILAQDSIASIESVDLIPIPESIVEISPYLWHKALSAGSYSSVCEMYKLRHHQSLDHC
jgi:hypothetical protein